MGDVTKDEAIDIATDYADEECVGELGEVLDISTEDSTWVVEFRTHTFDDSHVHEVKVTKTVGNIISHERSI